MAGGIVLRTVALPAARGSRCGTKSGDEPAAVWFCLGTDGGVGIQFWAERGSPGRVGQEFGSLAAKRAGRGSAGLPPGGKEPHSGGGGTIRESDGDGQRSRQCMSGKRAVSNAR